MTVISFTRSEEVTLSHRQARDVTRQWLEHVTDGYDIRYVGGVTELWNVSTPVCKRVEPGSLRGGEWELICAAFHMKKKIIGFIRANSGDNGK